MDILAVDFGSTYTKGVLLADDGTVLAVGAVPTAGTVGDGDILDGYHELRQLLEVRADAVVHACSSAGGGLRLAVVGYERSVTAEAGHRVGLCAGAKVVHVAAGALTTRELGGIRAARPDLVLLVGGTDGGNADVLLHNAARLAKGALGGHGAHAVPIVLAGNADAREEAATALTTTGRPTILADNVLPRIGVIAPESARAAIREAFLQHVIGGKGLSRDPAFARMVEAPTPEAVLRGVEVFAALRGGDALVVDIGGATTDVYSCLSPDGEDAAPGRDVVEPLWHARTVEGDLGMRWNAAGVIEAAESEHLIGPSSETDEALRSYAAHVQAHPRSVPVSDAEHALDVELARLAALIAVRRHARPAQPTESARPLAAVTTLIGSGGVLRHANERGRDHVLGAVLTDHAGGWKVPRDARPTVDEHSLLFAAGLLAGSDEAVARAVAGQLA